MNIIEKMTQFKSSYTSNEKKLYMLISKNPDLIHAYTITQVASFAGVSTSAMLRFCKRLGFNGYKDFKYEMESWLRAKHDSFSPDDPLSIIANSYSEIILSLPKICNDELSKLANAITASDKVIGMGRYRNKVVCEKLVMNLTNLGKTCLCASDLLSYEHFEKIIDGNSTVILFSVFHDVKSYQSIIDDIANLTDNFWLITSTENHSGKVGIPHVLNLPYASSSLVTLDQQAIMLIVVEMLTYIIRQKQM